MPGKFCVSLTCAKDNPDNATVAHCLKSQSISAAGIHAAFADGSVRFTGSGVSDPVWSAGETPADGEVIAPE